MRTLKEININSTEEEISKFCEDIPLLGLNSEIRQMYMDYATSLLIVKQQQKLLADQNSFNEKTLKTNKRLVTATWVLVIISVLIPLISEIANYRIEKDNVEIRKNCYQIVLQTSDIDILIIKDGFE